MSGKSTGIVGEASPRVTIVTVTLDRVTALERTLASVAEQTAEGLEYVVVDGGSKDGSERVADHPRVDVFISQPDRGISHAFNRGIKRARGEYLLFLNAGDTFLCRDAVAQLLDAAPVDGRMALISAQIDCGPKGLTPRRPPQTGDPDRVRARLAHQATLIPRSLFERFGPYSESFRIRMDYEWFLRVVDSVPLVWLSVPLVRYELGGLSSRPDMAFVQEAEALAAELLHERSTLRRAALLLVRGPWALGRALLKRLVWSLRAHPGRAS